MAGEKVLAEGLGAFQLSGSPAGAKTGQPGLAERINNARDQRHLRPDNG